jgi:hypothetical protein
MIQRHRTARLLDLVLLPVLAGRHPDTPFEGYTQVAYALEPGPCGDLLEREFRFHQQRLDPFQLHGQNLIVNRPL